MDTEETRNEDWIHRISPVLFPWRSVSFRGRLFLLNHQSTTKKASSTGVVNKAFQVERRGVEPPTSALRTQRSPN
jgi:hypothetical protein